MSFDPNHSSFGNYDENQEGDATPGNQSYRLAEDSNPGAVPFNFSSFMDFPTPSGWQPSPGLGNIFQQHQQQPHQHHHQPQHQQHHHHHHHHHQQTQHQHLPPQYSWPSPFQPGPPTPSSRSLSLPSSAQALQQQQQQPAFLHLQDVHIQPSSYNASGLFDFSQAQYQPFSPADTSTSSYKYQKRQQLQQVDDRAQHPSACALPSQPRLPTSKNASDVQSNFRFAVSLVNGTAMVKDNEIPVSYLNKRQTYKVKIRDTRPEHSTTNIPTTYRTYIRISFHEAKQRAGPAQHWQLWRDGRGMNEAQMHGGRLQAVEYIPSSLPSGGGQPANVHVEKESFDGFCVTWTVPGGYAPECEVQFRCNFLSTDFSRSKGVKGIPVRLCAKNEVVGFPNVPDAPAPAAPEICYCKIKLFRDHGAERKLTNDEAAVRRLLTKTEDLYKQAQASGSNDEDCSGIADSTGKRRALAGPGGSSRPSKMARGRREGSASSDASSAGQDMMETGGDLPAKIASLNRLLRSRQDVAAFFLPGDDGDDPDLYPVSLLETSEVGDSGVPDSPELDRLQRRSTQITDSSVPSGQSPTPTNPISPQQSRAQRTSATNLTAPGKPSSQQSSGDWLSDMKHEASGESALSNVQNLATPHSRGMKVERSSLQSRSGVSLNVADIDANYVAPAEPKLKPVASVYVQIRLHGIPPEDDLYRAVYLYERDAASLTQGIAKKQGLQADHIVDTIYISHERPTVKVKVDDDFVAHIPEGQDMLVDLTPVLAGLGVLQQQLDTTRVVPDGLHCSNYILTLRY